MTILAWHFISANKKLRFEPFSEIKVGETLTHTGELSLYRSGLHASIKPIDALSFVSWPDAIICRVKLSGEIVHGSDKLVASERTVLWMAPADDILREFACCCAEDVLHLADDKRSNAAVEAMRRFQIGAITSDELSAAMAAARDAARAAARDAARDAAWDAAGAAARDAAWDAAGAAARDAAGAAAWAAAWAAAGAAAGDAAGAAAGAAAGDAAWDAAGAAARAAAWDAAGAAARDAAGAAAWDAQNNLLEQMFFDAATFHDIDWEKYE
jgi:hypothetical protein